MKKILTLTAIFSLAAVFAGNAAFRAPKINYPDDTHKVGQFAAGELSNYWQKITGKTIGDEPEETIDLKIDPSKEEEAFTINISDKKIEITGGSPRGMLYGVYQLLNDIGVRWYRPEPWGEFTPELDEIILPLGSKDYAPSFKYREAINYRWWKSETPAQTNMVRLWGTRNRLNTRMWSIPQYGGFYTIDFQHSYYRRVPREKYFATHPEYFALRNGKRLNEPDAQLCVSNPEVQEIAIASILDELQKRPDLDIAALDPNDFEKWCECSNCKAWDDPSLKTGDGSISKSNRVFRFANIVAKGVAEKNPQAKIGSLAYNQHTEVPSLIEKLEPNIAVRIAAFAGAYSDYTKNLDDPASAANTTFLNLLKNWSEKCRGMTVYEYYGGYFWVGPMPLMHRMQERISAYKKLGVIGVYNEHHASWGSQGLNYYLYPLLMWNPDIDLDAELDLYYKNYFGPGVDAVKAYDQLLEAAIADGKVPVMSGGAGFDTRFNDPELLAAMATYIEQAEQAIGDQEPYKQRFAGVKAGYTLAKLVAQSARMKKSGDNQAYINAEKELWDFYSRYTAGDTFSNEDILTDGREYLASARAAAKQKLGSNNLPIIVFDQAGLQLYTETFDKGGKVGVDAEIYQNWNLNNQYCLSLLPGARGVLQYHVVAENNLTFDKVILRDIILYGAAKSNLAVEDSNGNWVTLAENLTTDNSKNTRFDLTKYTSGRKDFRVRYIAENTGKNFMLQWNHLVVEAELK